MTEDPGFPWNSILGKRHAHDSNKIRRHDNKLQLLKNLPAALYRGEEGATLQRDELEAILEPFRITLPAQEYVSLVRFLAKGLSNGKKKLRWNVPVPADLVSVPREQARFTPQSFTALHRLRRIESVLIQSLTVTGLPTKIQLGRLLLSAIIYGGLLQSKWLHPFIAALDGRVRARGTLLWLELERVWQYSRMASDEKESGAKIKDREILVKRRWFADPISRLLIIQWLRIPEMDRPSIETLPNPYDLVRQFLCYSGYPLSELPHSVKTLFAMSGTRLGLTVPPFLAAYAEGQVNAVSVPASTWARLWCRLPVPRQQEFTRIEGDEALSSRHPWRALAYATAPATPDEQRQLLKKMRRLVSTHGGSRHANASLIRELESFVTVQGEALCQYLQLLADWMLYNLSPKKRNASSTVTRYIGAAADAMLVVCGTDELLEWDSAEYQARYEQAIALVNSEKEKTVTRQNFGRFHKYLVQRYGAPYIALGFFLGRSGPVETTVDANLVSQIDFDRTKAALGWNNPRRSRNASAALIAAILGFRCGLRREEVQYLRFRDIHGRDRPELILRATAQRSLKTPSATRRLPLHVLLTIEELKFLLQWLDQFKNPERNALLLGIRGNLCVPLPEVVLLRPIRRALAQVTGDITLRFHHLRHSFATWLLLRLTGDVGNLTSFAPFFRHPEFHDYRIEKLRSEILGNEHLGRKGVYAVADLCGHADLDTTLKDYFHLCDWFMYREISRTGGVPFLDADAVVALSGKSRATVFRALHINKENNTKKWDWEALLGGISQNLPCTLDPLTPSPRKRQISEIVFPDDPIQSPWWELVERTLSMYQIQRKSAEVISRKLGIDEEKVEVWIKRAELMGSMRSRIPWLSSRYFRHLHLTRDDYAKLPSVTNLTLKDLFRNKARMRVFPYPPHLVVDCKLSLRMLNAFDQLNDEKHSEIVALAHDFVNHFSCQSGMRYFSDTLQASNYVNGLLLLGVPTKNIQLVDCKNNSYENKSMKLRRAHWAKSLSLKYPDWRINNKAWGRSSGEGTVGVQVVNDVGGTRRASYGFRYALYMIALAFGKK